MNLTGTIPACYYVFAKIMALDLCSVCTPTIISLNIIEVHLMKVYILRGKLSLARIYK